MKKIKWNCNEKKNGEVPRIESGAHACVAHKAFALFVSGIVNNLSWMNCLMVQHCVCVDSVRVWPLNGLVCGRRDGCACVGAEWLYSNKDRESS